MDIITIENTLFATIDQVVVNLNNPILKIVTTIKNLTLVMSCFAKLFTLPHFPTNRMFMKNKTITKLQ